MDFGRDQVTRITQGTLNRRHPVSVPGRRVKTLLGHGCLCVQRAQCWHDGTDHTLQVISKGLNISRKALIPTAEGHAAGGAARGCVPRACLHSELGHREAHSLPSAPSKGRDKDDLPSSFAQFHSPWSRLSSGSCLQHQDWQMPKGEHKI